MKKIILTGALFFILISATAGYHSAGHAAQGGKAFLWEIKVKSGSSYILGSIHIGREGIYPLDPAIEKAYEQSDVLVVEIDFTRYTPQELLEIMLEKAFFMDGRTLESCFSKDDYALLKKRLLEMEIPVEKVGGWRPWFLSNLVEAVIQEQNGFDPNLGIDGYFLDKAVNVKKIIQFETPQFQAALLGELPDQYFSEDLMETIKAPDPAANLRRMMDVWLSGDLKTLEEQVFDKAKDSRWALFYEKIYYERNQKQAAKIAELIKTGEAYFIVVGMGHLVGEKSIIEQLRGLGVEVNRL